ncbi:hypothetical protein [Halorubrum vacuolatum]|uniref:Uncharacterized protein n=1 Tax=Halorubrum vacuolatum TaxID=63740 RepID=A0A238VCA6_HALVU|nr:hypothetical protein [Halorubrum vacuolatum]SNR31808.1 hypothetical protein SAMN06264855_102228 [Halorubrum vacuolatum]
MEPLEPTDDLLESLYVVNKVAKQLADEATVAYERDDVTRSNRCSARKEALYRTKTTVLTRVVAYDPTRVTGEYHAINGDPWLHLTVDGWHFHQPPRAIGEALTDRIEVKNTESTPREAPYVRDATVKRSDRSLERALIHLAAHGVNANDHLPAPTISGTDDRLVDVRWACLRGR